jgi:tetratricopeptide (TPR) repeat protein
MNNEIKALYDLLYWQATDLARERRYREAELILANFEQAEDNYKAKVYDLRGRILVQQQEYARARAFFQKAVALAPGNAEYQTALQHLPEYERNSRWLPWRWKSWAKVRQHAWSAGTIVLLATLTVTTLAYMGFLKEQRNQTKRITELETVAASLPPNLDAAKFQVAGCTTTRSADGDITITLPDNGPSASQLSFIGTALSNNHNGVLVTAEAPRQTQPLSPRRSEWFAIRQAVILTQVLAELSTLPLTQFSVRSAADTNTTALAVRITRRIPELP